MVITPAPLNRDPEIKPGRVNRVDQHVELLWHNHQWHLSQHDCWLASPTNQIIGIEEAVTLPVLARKNDVGAYTNGTPNDVQDLDPEPHPER
jgi:hypothetical protein